MWEQRVPAQREDRLRADSQTPALKSLLTFALPLVSITSVGRGVRDAAATNILCCRGSQASPFLATCLTPFLQPRLCSPRVSGLCDVSPSPERFPVLQHLSVPFAESSTWLPWDASPEIATLDLRAHLCTWTSHSDSTCACPFCIFKFWLAEQTMTIVLSCRGAQRQCHKLKTPDSLETGCCSICTRSIFLKMTLVTHQRVMKGCSDSGS